MIYGYARVSTGDQTAALQIDALEDAGCERIFHDTASGATSARPELDKLMDQVRPGDTLTVWRLDRLGRSVRHLVDSMTDLDNRCIHFRSLRESIDTSTAPGRLVFHIFAGLAEFERDLIRERTGAGLAAARARGRTGGRPPALNDEQLRAAAVLLEARDMTVKEIARTLGVSRSTIYRSLPQPSRSCELSKASSTSLTATSTTRS